MKSKEVDAAAEILNFDDAIPIKAETAVVLVSETDANTTKSVPVNRFIRKNHELVEIFSNLD